MSFKLGNQDLIEMWTRIEVFFEHRSQRSIRESGATEKPAEISAGFCFMERKYLTEPKSGSNGGTITNKARKVLGQPIMKPAPKVKEPEKPKTSLDRIVDLLSAK